MALRRSGITVRAALMITLGALALVILIAAAQWRTFAIGASMALILPLIAWLAVRRMLAPLTTLRDEIHALDREHDSQALLTNTGMDEVSDVANEFNRILTESRAATQALAASENRLRTITDNMPALIGYMDTEERYSLVNRTFTHWFGHEPAEYRLLDQAVHGPQDERGRRRGEARSL